MNEPQLALVNCNAFISTPHHFHTETQSGPETDTQLIDNTSLHSFRVCGKIDQLLKKVMIYSIGRSFRRYFGTACLFRLYHMIL